MEFSNIDNTYLKNEEKEKFENDLKELKTNEEYNDSSKNYFFLPEILEINSANNLIKINSTDSDLNKEYKKNKVLIHNLLEKSIKYLN